jgi:hypothetical protein
VEAAFQPTAADARIAELNGKLAMMRHNVNNHLALIVAASELIRRRPELAARMIENILQQPERINTEIRGFSEAFEVALGVKRSSPGAHLAGAV